MLIGYAQQIYLAAGTTDLRKSIDGLAVIVQESFRLDPFSKYMFVFCNRQKNKIKILQWDDTGFWLYYKRLERGCFRWPSCEEGEVIELHAREFGWLLDGLKLEQKQAHPVITERQII